MAVLLAHPNVKFRVSTNGRKGHKPGDQITNITFVVDQKSGVEHDRLFVPTLIAPVDLTLGSPDHYWQLAQKQCPVWKECATSIYNGKAYFCEVAAAMDHLFHGGENGWVIEGKYPFDKTDEEIAEQAKKFCYRCAWCIEDQLKRQPITDPSYVSLTNVITSPHPQRLEVVDAITLKK